MKHLRRGEVYRREDLLPYSSSVDRELSALVKDGTLVKISNGLYHYPRVSVFGRLPPDETKLIRKFLRGGEFLMTSPNLYNGLGVGTTQLYNKTVVYNHKRKGRVVLGNREFQFVDKSSFPKKMTLEFLIVDLVNNLDSLAEDTGQVLDKVKGKASTMDKGKLRRSVESYGSPKTRSLMKSIIS